MTQDSPAVPPSTTTPATVTISNTTPTPSIPGKPTLQDEKLQLEITKLRQDTSLLQRMIPFFGIGSVLATLIVATTALTTSTAKIDLAKSELLLAKADARNAEADVKTFRQTADKAKAEAEDAKVARDNAEDRLLILTREKETIEEQLQQVISSFECTLATSLDPETVATNPFARALMDYGAVIIVNLTPQTLATTRTSYLVLRSEFAPTATLPPVLACSSDVIQGVSPYSVQVYHQNLINRFDCRRIPPMPSLMYYTDSDYVDISCIAHSDSGSPKSYTARIDLPMGCVIVFDGQMLSVFQ